MYANNDSFIFQQASGTLELESYYLEGYGTSPFTKLQIPYVGSGVAAGFTASQGAGSTLAVAVALVPTFSQTQEDDG